MSTSCCRGPVSQWEGPRARLCHCCCCCCCRNAPVTFAEYGTILHINSVEPMEDGRFLIATRGERRFKVHGRGMMDGYHMAKITFLFDNRVMDKEEIGMDRSGGGVAYEEVYVWCVGKEGYYIM